MTDLNEALHYEKGIYQLETTDPVVGGPEGVSNLQAKQLANRTAWLKQQVEQLENDITATLKVHTDNSDPHSVYLTEERGDTRYYPRDDVKAMIGHLNPVGSVIAYAGDQPPEGWLECDGVAVSRSVYADLFKIIGTIYGEGDRATTFNVPDLRAYFVMGWDHGRNLDKKRKLGSAISHGYHGYSDENNRQFIMRHMALMYCVKY